MTKETITLAAVRRDLAVKPTAIRAAAAVPGVVYGSTEHTVVQCNAKELRQAYTRAGENTLVSLSMDGKSIPCLIHAISFHPVSGAITHVDFYAVDMKKKVSAHVPVIFSGESPAVKTLGGVLVTVHGQLEVSCLPSDLPENFVVSLQTLENFRDTITVADLVLPAGVTVKNSPETVIVTVQEPRKEEVVTPTVVEGAAATPADGAAAPAAEGTAPAAKAEEKPAAKK